LRQAIKNEIVELNNDTQFAGIREATLEQNSSWPTTKGEKIQIK